MEDTKICTKCGEEKPLSQYYWYKKGQRPYPHCIPCNAEITRRKRMKYGYTNMAQRLTNKPNTWKDENQRIETWSVLECMGWKFNEEKGIWYDNKIKDKDGNWLVNVRGRRAYKKRAYSEKRAEYNRKKRYLPIELVPVLNLRDESISEEIQRKVMVAYFHLCYSIAQLKECFSTIPEDKLRYMITRGSVILKQNGTRQDRGD